jgi:hypothetical protein
MRKHRRSNSASPTYADHSLQSSPPYDVPSIVSFSAESLTTTPTRRSVKPSFVTEQEPDACTPKLDTSLMPQIDILFCNDTGECRLREMLQKNNTHKVFDGTGKLRLENIAASDAVNMHKKMQHVITGNGEKV